MEDSIAMNGGDGPNSYTKNSKMQKEGSEKTKVLLSKSIQEALDIQNHAGAYTIADLGCSVGPNSFICIGTIIEAVQLKFRTHDPESKNPEFHVFFNDYAANDFNTLFKALPLKRNYMAAGVPGSFYGRLFPKESMNLMHSSFALHWLSKVPEEVTKEESRAWNKGRITYALSSYEVVKAFTRQFLSDMEAFFSARSIELAKGGLMGIVMPCRPEGTLPSEAVLIHAFECIGNAIADMVKQGLVSETLLDSFNLPIFIPSPSEVKEVASKNKLFRIERTEEIYYGQPTKLGTPQDAHNWSLHIRAGFEGTVRKHFGNELIDEIFRRCSEKLEELSKTPRFSVLHEFRILFVLVKRCAQF